VPVVTQLAGKYVEDVGGMDLERKLAFSLAGKYSLNLEGMRTKVNIMGDCEAVKEALSEIPATQFRFTAMKDSNDRTVRVKLKDLLDISEEMNNTITNVVVGAFTEAGIDKVDRVEVVGGSVRVPFVQEAISNAFAGARLQWTLDTEGFAAMAAGYLAARKSPEFTVRRLEKTDFLTATSVLMTRGQNISLFTPGMPRHTVWVVNVSARPGQTFVIGTDWNLAYFIKFKLKHRREMNVSLTFAISDFLNPYVVNATGPDGSPIQIEFETMDWDLAPAALEKSTKKVKQMIEMRNARAESERQEASLREYLTRLKRVAETNAQLPAKQKSQTQSAVKATEK
jgi:molecular chaperone DnaK (HSP70)